MMMTMHAMPRACISPTDNEPQDMVECTQCGRGVQDVSCAWVAGVRITCNTHSSGHTKTSAEPKRLVHERLFLAGGASTSGPECPFSSRPANSACFSASSSSAAGAGLRERGSAGQDRLH